MNFPFKLKTKINTSLLIKSLTFLLFILIQFSVSKALERCILLEPSITLSQFKDEDVKSLKEFCRSEALKLTRFSVFSKEETAKFIKDKGILELSNNIGPKTVKELLDQTEVKYFIATFFTLNPNEDGILVEMILYSTNPQIIHLSKYEARSANDYDSLEAKIKGLFAIINDSSLDNPMYEKDMGLTALDFYNDGVIQLKRNNFKEAAEAFTRAISMSPENLDAYLNRARCYVKLKNPKKATEDFNQVERLDPKNSDVYLERGIMKFELDSYNEAIEDFKKGITVNPKDYRFYLKIAMVKVENNNKQEALEDVKKAMTISNEPEIYTQAGDIESLLGNKDSAMAYYNKSISIRNDNPGAYYKRGILNFEKGDKAAACADWDKAIQFGSKEARGKAFKNCRK